MYEIDFTTSSFSSIFASSNNFVTSLLNFLDKTADLKLESKAGKDISKIEISCKNTGDMVTLHVTNTTTDKYSFEDIKSK